MYMYTYILHHMYNISVEVKVVLYMCSNIKDASKNTGYFCGSKLRVVIVSVSRQTNFSNGIWGRN